VKPDTLSALNHLVSEAIDLVVHTERTSTGPRVTSILAVEDLVAGPEAVQFTTTELFRRERDGDELAWTGLVPMRAGERCERLGIDLRRVCDGDDAGDGGPR
jgi:pilus assembly protein CpaF